MWKTSFSTMELQFYSSLKTNVSILPNFSDTEIYLLSGKVGPFRANHQIPVPLWLALQLKANQKCTMIPPFWLEEDTLLSFQDKQRRNPHELTNLQHEEFFEISYVYLSKAPDNVPKLPQMRALVEGLENMRREKVRKLFQQAKGAVRLINLTTYEANRIREPLSTLGMMVQRLRTVEK